MQGWCGNYSEYLRQLIEEKTLLGNIAIMSPAGNITYEQFFKGINRAGNFLLEQGVVPGDRILLIMNDSPSLMYHFMAAIRIGVIPVLLNTLLPPREYSYYVEDSGAKMYVVDDVLSHKTVGLERMCAGFINSQNKDHLMDYSSKLEFYSCGPSDPAFWQYSSGSTAKPKAVIHNHKAPVEIFNKYAKNILQITSEDRLFSVSRAFFGYGLGNSLFFPTLAGATSILFEGPINVENVVRVVKQFRPTIFFSVPSFYGQLLASDESIRSFYQFASQIRLAISAGESLPSSTYHIWKELTNIDLLDGIGSTEALHIFMSNHPDSVRPGSCGKPLSGVNVKFIQTDNLNLGFDSHRLMINYSGLANGYWQRPDLTAKTFVGGWLDTGDLFRVDKEGFYWHVGRSDDLFKVKGMWVSPVEVEEALLQDKRVADCAVVGISNEQGFTEVTAYIVLNDSKQQNVFADEVSCHLEELLVNYKIPRKYRFISAIPMTTTGKKKRYELRGLANHVDGVNI